MFKKFFGLAMTFMMTFQGFQALAGQNSPDVLKVDINSLSHDQVVQGLTGLNEVVAGVGQDMAQAKKTKDGRLVFKIRNRSVSTMVVALGIEAGIFSYVYVKRSITGDPEASAPLARLGLAFLQPALMIAAAGFIVGAVSEGVILMTPKQLEHNQKAIGSIQNRIAGMLANLGPVNSK